MPDGHLGGSRIGRVSRGRRPLHVPAPDPSPIPPKPAAVIELQQEITTSVEQQSIVVGGQNQPIRIVYGAQILGADISGVVKSGVDLVLRCTWCEGEVDAIERFWINGNDPPSYFTAGSYFNHYTGATGQGIDPILKYAYQLAGKVYNDTLPGICYSVFELPPGISSGFPQITALIRGRKVSLTSGGAKTYSTNPAYAIADLIENTTFGMGRSVDWTSVGIVGDACDEMIGSPAEKRHIFGLAISDAQPVESWLAVMADYAGCWIVPEGDSYRLVLDATGTVGATKTILDITQAFPARVQATSHGFAEGAILKVSGLQEGMVEANGAVAVCRVVNPDHVDLAGIDATDWTAYTTGGSITQIGTSVYSFDESNILGGTFTAQKKGTMDQPTVIEVDYTNATVYPWRTETIDPVYVPGVEDGSVPFRRTSVSKPGLTRHSEAHRYAVELLNSAQLDDLSCSFTAFDVALKLQVGDLIDVTHPSGLESKIMRLVRAEPIAPGRWDIQAVEHDDAKYSTLVVSGPSPSDTPLDSPLAPPTVTGLAAVEVISVNASGAYVSQLSITWTEAATSYPFVLNYRVDILDGPTLVETATVQRSLTADPPKYVSGALPENVSYRIRVTTISTLLAESVAAETSITNSGKSSKPSDVQSISAYEVGGEVHILIEPATDVDLTAHEYRYGDPGTSDWDSATLLDRVGAPSVRYSTRVIPAGTWRIYVKGLDSVRTPIYPYGQESVNAIYVDVAVTSDAGAFVAAEYSFFGYSVSGMSLHQSAAGDQYFVSNDGSTWNDIVAGTVASLTDEIFRYFASATATLTTNHHDFGLAIAGTWTGIIAYQDISGTADTYLELLDDATDTPPYDEFAGLQAKTTARWGYIKVTSAGCLLVTNLGVLRVAVVARTESGTVTTSAAGAVTVNLTGEYAKAVAIQLTPTSGSTPRFATYDNVVVGAGVTNSFDAYCFDAAGTKTANDCSYVFSGI